MENKVLDLSLMAADLNENMATTNNTQHVAAPIDFTGNEQIASTQQSIILASYQSDKSLSITDATKEKKSNQNSKKF